MLVLYHHLKNYSKTILEVERGQKWEEKTNLAVHGGSGSEGGVTICGKMVSYSSGASFQSLYVKGLI